MLNRDNKGRFIKKEEKIDNKELEIKSASTFYSYKKIGNNAPEITGKKITILKDGKKEEKDLAKEAEEYFKNNKSEQILLDFCPSFNSFKGIGWNPFDLKSNWYKLLN